MLLFRFRFNLLLFPFVCAYLYFMCAFYAAQVLLLIQLTHTHAHTTRFYLTQSEIFIQLCECMLARVRAVIAVAFAVHQTCPTMRSNMHAYLSCLLPCLGKSYFKRLIMLTILMCSPTCKSAAVSTHTRMCRYFYILYRGGFESVALFVDGRAFSTS